MELLGTGIVLPKYQEQVLRIWNEAYPTEFGFDDLKEFTRYLKCHNSPWHILAFCGGEVIGWASAFNREGKRWFVVIVDQKYRKQGVGSAMLQALHGKGGPLHGWVIYEEHHLKDDGSPYHSPLPFYQHIGFEVTSETTDLGGFMARRVISMPAQQEYVPRIHEIDCNKHQPSRANDKRAAAV